ncbi:serine hydrolase domain-containing protein [Aquimarina pacifica]|uniref:serine hydrolase domain-containing protein n=1 Tax=Aquimarina pacifica TaxID=1296415 RepID=UPI00047148B9|nr:serine hydrolase domain-containing protein [Aquimarina pacifica]
MKTNTSNHIKACNSLTFTTQLRKQFFLIMLVFTTCIMSLNVHGQSPKYIKNTIQSVEKMLDSKDNEALIKFIEQSMVKNGNRDKTKLIDSLKAIRTEMRGLREDISVDTEPEGLRLMMSAGKKEKHLMIVMNDKAKAISHLYLVAPPEPLNVTLENISETFNQLEKDGAAGLIYVKINGETILRRAFGYANKELGIPNDINTIFGTGSRSIDYTVAAIYLLNQRGLLNTDNIISKYLKDVPKDKSKITIQHLLSGQSGLPDFFDTDADWDPDLAWVDRETAVKRMLSQELLFEPGTDRKHSHGAFGMLAAIVEIVSGLTYYEFLNDNFFKPAGMKRTGEYGKTKELTISDFAVGGGPMFVGLPNIPPNWGPTSWLVKGSGGMYSTLDDLLKFYNLVRSNKVLDAKHNQWFTKSAFNLDGSDRGFELFSAYLPSNSEIYLFLNNSDHINLRQVIQALERLIDPN